MYKLTRIVLSVLIFVSPAFICADPAQTKLAAAATNQQPAQSKLATASDQQDSGSATPIKLSSQGLRQLRGKIRASLSKQENLEFDGYMNLIAQSIRFDRMVRNATMGALWGTLIGMGAGSYVINKRGSRAKDIGFTLLMSDMLGMAVGAALGFGISLVRS